MTTPTWTPTGETAAQLGDGANRDRASEAGDLPVLMGRWTDGPQKLTVCTETKMNFPLWRYGAYAFAIAATLCLAAANVAWAWSLDDGVYRYVMIAVSVAADIGAPCALMAMMHYHGEKDPTSALAAFVVWSFCGYAEVKGAETWLKANTFVISAPAIKATEAQKAASVELEAETANLAEIRKLLAGERREVKLDALQRREKAALERLEKLRPQTFTTSVEPARSQYIGNELALAFALWLLSQVAWKMAIGRMHGSKMNSDHGTARPVVPTVRPTVRQEALNTVPAFPGAARGVNSQNVENTQDERVHVHGEHPVRPVLSLVFKDPFAEQAMAYSKAGFSVRQIAKSMGCSPTKIQNVLTALKTHATTHSGQ
jgi:hypothetical protein